MIELSQVNIDLGIISEFSEIIAAFITSCTAIWGVSTWKKQLKAKAELDLARGLMRSLGQLESSIVSTRIPWQTSNKTMEAELHIQHSEDLHQNFKHEYDVQSALYQKRWEVITKSINNLNNTLFEAEALWGETVIRKADGLFDCIGKLYRAIDDYLISIQYPETTNKDEYEKCRRIMAIPGGFSGPDEFSDEMNEAIKVIKEYIKPKLRITKK